MRGQFSRRTCVRPGALPAGWAFDSAPGIFVGVVAEARDDRVGEDVGDRGLVLLLRLDHPRVEAGAEQVAVARRVQLVEALGVDAVQPLHPVGEVGAGAVDDQVVVRSHEAVGVAVPAVAVDRLGQELEEEDAVRVSPE
jgi:hypothetical protein